MFKHVIFFFFLFSKLAFLKVSQAHTWKQLPLSPALWKSVLPVAIAEPGFVTVDTRGKAVLIIMGYMDTYI